MKLQKIKKRYVVVGIVVLLLLIIGGVALYANHFLSAETDIRDDWTIETGDFLLSDEALHVSSFKASFTSDLPVLQILPEEYKEEGFTYYDETVQKRLAAAIVNLSDDREYSLEEPLVIFNPFGTTGNGLYFYFQTQRSGHIRYTIQVAAEDIPDYTATAYEEKENTTRHEFQMVGLVPGMTNTVTMELVGPRGKTLDTMEFTIDMPETTSGYAVQLDYTEGDSDADLSDGLYSMIRVGGYNGYSFFYDNSGVMRYEMVLEGYSLDRILWYEDNLLACVSAYKVAQFNRLGQVVAVYDTGDYELHHDIALGKDGELLALASDTKDEVNVEDLLIQIDLESGEVKECIDFKDLLADYYTEETSPLTVTDEFFWLAGQNDWIHLNTLQYIPEDDSVIVSSRETSTIIKITDIHTAPTLKYLIGDEDFWADTAYADYSYTQEGDFVPQYGQHTVEYAADPDLPDGQYYLYMYDNNYWVNGTRDSYTIEDLPESVGTVLASNSLNSHVYTYLVDENAGTFSLVDSFDVPYSSIVSNVTTSGENRVVNSGTANVFGEYDSEGALIRQFSYDCELQTYRVMKEDFVGFWYGESKD